MTKVPCAATPNTPNPNPRTRVVTINSATGSTLHFALANLDDEAEGKKKTGSWRGMVLGTIYIREFHGADEVWP